MITKTIVTSCDIYGANVSDLKNYCGKHYDGTEDHLLLSVNKIVRINLFQECDCDHFTIHSFDILTLHCPITLTYELCNIPIILIKSIQHIE